MQKHIDRYLKKAHLQAVGKSVKSKIEFIIFKKMVKIFDKIYPNITIDFPYNFKEFLSLGALRHGRGSWKCSKMDVNMARQNKDIYYQTFRCGN